MTVVGQLFAFIDTVPSPWNQVIKALLILAGLGYLLIKTFKYVPQGHKALRLRFQTVVYKNGAPVVLEQGLHIMFPFVHSLKIVSVLDRTINLQDIALCSDSYVVNDVRASVVLRVCDIYKVTYVVDDFIARITAACEHFLRLALPVGWHDNTLDVAPVMATFEKLVADTTDELGVKFVALNISNVNPNAIIMVAGAIDKLGRPAAAALEQLGLTTQSINGSVARDS